MTGWGGGWLRSLLGRGHAQGGLSRPSCIPAKAAGLPLAAAGVPGSLAPGRAAALGQGCPALQRELRGCQRPPRLLSSSCQAAVAEPRIWTF